MPQSTALPAPTALPCTFRRHQPSHSAFLSSPGRDYRLRLRPKRRISSIQASPARSRDSLQVSCCIADSQKLGPLKLENILTPEGRIHSNVLETTKASVFAIFDEHKKLQYIGFSKGLEESLRAVFTRRPDKAYFYKSVNLTKLDQKEMISIRDAWFEEVGGPPAGNKLAMERTAWQQPVDATANVTGSKSAAAEKGAKELLEKIRSRGCIEEYIPNPEALIQGQIDLVLSETLSEEEIAERREKMEAVARATRYGKALFQEEETEFSVYFKQEILTNGGTMFDVMVSHNEQDTSHRIIVGEEYYEPHGLQAQEVVMQAFAFVIEEEMERQTEGLLLMTQFPINYFTVAELDQRFPEFRQHFHDHTGATLTGDKFWRFNRIYDYGPILEQLEGYESPMPKYGEVPLLKRIE